MMRLLLGFPPQHCLHKLKGLPNLIGFLIGFSGTLGGV